MPEDLFSFRLLEGPLDLRSSSFWKFGSSLVLSGHLGCIRASNRFANRLCIHVFAKKSLKNTYLTVWYLKFAILLTWQKERND